MSATPRCTDADLIDHPTTAYRAESDDVLLTWECCGTEVALGGPGARIRVYPEHARQYHSQATGQPLLPIERTTVDRRSQPRREAELRLHLARELVISKARQLVAAHTAATAGGAVVVGHADVRDQLDTLADLVAVLTAAEAPT